jgi:hypothetical protein
MRSKGIKRDQKSTKNSPHCKLDYSWTQISAPFPTPACPEGSGLESAALSRTLPTNSPTTVETHFSFSCNSRRTRGNWSGLLSLHRGTGILRFLWLVVEFFNLFYFYGSWGIFHYFFIQFFSNSHYFSNVLQIPIIFLFFQIPIIFQIFHKFPLFLRPCPNTH